jgi:hypothetical protein
VLLFTTGASSVLPVAMMGNVGVAGSGLRNYAPALHQALAADGIYAALVAVDLYEQRDRAELKVGNYIEQALAGAST